MIIVLFHVQNMPLLELLLWRSLALYPIHPVALLHSQWLCWHSVALLAIITAEFFKVFQDVTSQLWLP